MLKKGRDGASIRKERMLLIMAFVKDGPEGRTLDQIQREIAWRTGLTARKVADYVRELV